MDTGVDGASREQQLFDFIAAHLERHGYQPSIREIMTELGFKSTKSVADLLASMDQQGMIRAGHGRSRGIELLGVAVKVTRTVGDSRVAVEPPLAKPIEEWTDDEKQKLVDGDLELWSTIEGDYAGVKAIRGRLVAGEETFSRADVVKCLNTVESTRTMAHWVFAIGDRNRQAMQRRLSNALCAFCKWEYKGTFELPEDRALEPEEVDRADAEINAAIVEHIKTCPNHPMRAMERELAALRASRSAWEELAEHLEHCATCGQTGPADCFEGGQLREAALNTAVAPRA